MFFDFIPVNSGCNFDFLAFVKKFPEAPEISFDPLQLIKTAAASKTSQTFPKSGFLKRTFIYVWSVFE